MSAPGDRNDDGPHTPDTSHTPGTPGTRDDGPGGIDAIEGLARLALSAWWRTTGWAVRFSLTLPRQALEGAAAAVQPPPDDAKPSAPATAARSSQPAGDPAPAGNDAVSLEAQPEVLEAIHSVRQAKVVRRSIHLTPFGEDFCRVCLTADGRVSNELPPHAVPRRTDRAPQPPTESVDG